jgi:hypothetical protein
MVLKKKDNNNQPFEKPKASPNKLTVDKKDEEEK